MSNETRTAAHAAIDRASPEHLAQTAHNVIEDLCGVIDAIARQAAAQSHHYIHHPRPSTSLPPSKATEEEMLQERQVVAIEAIAEHLETLASAIEPARQSWRDPEGWAHPVSARDAYLRTGGV
jgi:hypothetical protein